MANTAIEICSIKINGVFQLEVTHGSHLLMQWKIASQALI